MTVQRVVNTACSQRSSFQLGDDRFPGAVQIVVDPTCLKSCPVLSGTSRAGIRGGLAAGAGEPYGRADRSAELPGWWAMTGDADDAALREEIARQEQQANAVGGGVNALDGTAAARQLPGVQDRQVIGVHEGR